jgi:hypothetical protein
MSETATKSALKSSGAPSGALRPIKRIQFRPNVNVRPIDPRSKQAMEESDHELSEEPYTNIKETLKPPYRKGPTRLGGLTRAAVDEDVIPFSNLYEGRVPYNDPRYTSTTSAGHSPIISLEKSPVSANKAHETAVRSAATGVIYLPKQYQRRSSTVYPEEYINDLEQIDKEDNENNPFSHVGPSGLADAYSASGNLEGNLQREERKKKHLAVLLGPSSYSNSASSSGGRRRKQTRRQKKNKRRRTTRK